MDILQWLMQSLQINGSELAQQNQSQSVNSLLLLAYMVISVALRKPSYVMAFFASCMLFDAELFDPLSESQLYAITFAIYSYVIFDIERNGFATLACGILIALIITIGYDAYFYGAGGYYGEAETIVYDNIESLALSAHTILIASLIHYRRIWNNILSFFDSIVSSTSSAYNVLYIIQSIREKAYP